VPLLEQEKCSELVVRLQENQQRVEDDLKKVEVCVMYDDLKVLTVRWQYVCPG